MPANASPKKVFVGVAWPYSNGSLHLGQIAGAYLPPDIFARYHRAAGNEVLMVSGSDQHGTPITVRAEQEGRTPGDVAAQFHAEFLQSWEQLGISFDLFTTTGTDNHARVSQDIFLKLLERGDIYQATMQLPYCTVENRFLLDRYVEGTCPNCGYESARGDQCDNCGRVLDPVDLINRRCKFDGSEPELRDSEHFFHRLSAYNDRLKEWLSDKHSFWRKPVINWALGWLKEGLQDRAITRDVQWGVPIPVDGWDDKRIYVWFEAVIGYLSASIEWAGKSGDSDRWREFWQDPDCRHFYFIGKDNIPFHTLIWPAYLMGYAEAAGEPYNLPYDVPANQYQTIKGSKASTSRRLAVFVPDFLSRYDPDPLRYYLATTMPETSDSDFTWADFVRRNNDELVATWGNLVNRVLTFTYRNFDRAVPSPGALSGDDQALLARVEQAITDAGEQIEQCHFRAGLEAAMSVAREANRYFEDSAPWNLIKEDRDRCATVLHTAIGAIAGLSVALSPFLPFTCQTLHGYLGNEGPIAAVGWRFAPPRAGQPLAEAQPLFKKLEPSIVDEEDARLGA
jgi:methionyl-tRNA synthetase